MEGKASELPGILTSVSNHLSLLSQTVARLAEQHDQEVVRLTRDLNRKNQELVSQLTRLGGSGVSTRENSRTSKAPEFTDETSEENKTIGLIADTILVQPTRGPRTGGALPLIRGDLMSDLTPLGPEGSCNGPAQDELASNSGAGGDASLEEEKHFSPPRSSAGAYEWSEISEIALSGQHSSTRSEKSTFSKASIGQRLKLAQVWQEAGMAPARTTTMSKTPFAASVPGFQRSHVKLQLSRSKNFETENGTGSKPVKHSFSRRFGSDMSLGAERREAKPDPMSNICRFLAYRMIARPSSLRRLAWEVLGMVLIFYDLVVIPLQTFDLESTPFLTVMTWVTAVFWTLDVPSSFLVGFNRAGIIEMRLKPIALHYMKTWFLLDIVVVGVDWTILIGEKTSKKEDGGQATEYLGFGKALRLLRLARLLRLMKVHGMLVDITERVQSEFIRIMLGLTKLIIFIVSMNHVVACGFYGVGVIWEEEREDTWVVDNDLLHSRLDYRYTTALHWSLTQFTPASMEVVPKNSLERAYTVCTIIVAMMTFSSLVSSITNAMTQLRNLNSEKLEKEKILRRYLRENSINVSLMSRIWAWLANATDPTRYRTHERDVLILSLLPRSLRTELQDQVFLPFLQGHPWFFQFRQAFPLGMRKIYECIREVSSALGQEVFSIGEVAHDMFFVSVGSLMYEMLPAAGVAAAGYEPGSEVSSGWVCEQALWLEWKHRGRLVAKMHSELFGLQTVMFHSLFSRELHEVWQAGKYARLFQKHLESKEHFSDISLEFDTLQDIAQAAFSDMPEDELFEMSADRQRSRRGGRRSVRETIMSNVFKLSGQSVGDEHDQGIEASHKQRSSSVGSSKGSSTGFFGRVRGGSKSSRDSSSSDEDH